MISGTAISKPTRPVTDPTVELDRRLDESEAR